MSDARVPGEIISVVACTESQSRGCPHVHQTITTAYSKVNGRQEAVIEAAIKRAKALARIGRGKSCKFNCSGEWRAFTCLICDIRKTTQIITKMCLSFFQYLQN